MISGISGFNLKKLLTYVDWKLLSFLFLFLNVKLAVKIPAVIIIYLLQFNFKFGFSLKNSRLPLFYPLIIGIALINFVIYKGYSNLNYVVVCAVGISFWIACLLAVHQIKLLVDGNSIQILHNTILVFFVINAAVSFATLAYIMADAHAINPFRYQGQYQKYFLGTGDYIKGITFDISTTNAVINAFGVIYFLTRKQPVMVLICMAVLLLTASNFINIALFLILAVLFLFKTNRDQKSLILICSMFLVVFLIKVSPQNSTYVHETFKNIIHPPHPPYAVVVTSATDSTKSPEFLKRTFAKHYLDSLKAMEIQKTAKAPVKALSPSLPQTEAGRIVVVGADINTPPYQTPTDTPAEQNKLLAFVHKHKIELPLSGHDAVQTHLPGKAIGFVQTLRFLENHPQNIVAGAGMGNFSSKLAFKATGLDFSGGFPAKFVYISHQFLINHLDVYLNFYSKIREQHSITNNPFSVYDQLPAEYGLLGVVVFMLFYVGYFARHFKKLTYGLPILFLMLFVFCTDYWFEQLSIVVFFELLLLVNIKETETFKTLNYEQQ